MQSDEKLAKASEIIKAKTGYEIKWELGQVDFPYGLGVKYRIHFCKNGFSPGYVQDVDPIIDDYPPEDLAMFLICAGEQLIKKGDKILDSIKP